MLPALCQTRLHPRLRETARCGQFFIYSIFTNSAEVVPLSPAAIIILVVKFKKIVQTENFYQKGIILI